MCVILLYLKINFKKYKFKLIFLYFKVNEHLKDIMEQEQKLKEHHTVEAPGGQKVYISNTKGAFMRLCICSHICIFLGNVNSCVY